MDKKRGFALLGQHYEPEKHIVTGWMASEKLDGQRAIWLPNCDFDFSDTQEQPTGLWTRDGKIIHAPKWWLDKLPRCGLDGELHLGRNAFQDTMSIVRRKNPSELWSNIKYNCFDMPVLMEAGTIHFKHRSLSIPQLSFNNKLTKQPIFRNVYNYMIRNFEENDVFKIVSQVYIDTVNNTVDKLLQTVLEKGGEGLMLRDPGSVWKQERNNSLLKVKPFLSMKVKVLGYYYGEGKYDGMMGALEVITENGKVFKLSGFSDEERKIGSAGIPFKRSMYDDCFMFPIGKVINITYRELTKDGIPKEARYSRDN